MTHPQQSYPLLSIIVPVYNAETVLPQTIGNIILQTVFDRFGEEAAEIILVDDASTDQTPALLQDVHRQYPNRTKILTLPENRGAGGARNAGMEKAAGAYIGFTDSDDLIDPSFYETLLEEAGKEDLDLVDSPIFQESTGEAFLTTPYEFHGRVTGEMRSKLLSNVGFPVTKLYRASLLKENSIRFRERTVTEDEDFLAEVYGRIRSIGVLTTLMYKYQDNEGSSTKKDTGLINFDILADCVLAAYRKLTKIPDYASFQEGAESFYCNRIALALILYQAMEEAEEHNSLCASAIWDQLLQKKALLKEVYRQTVRENPALNPYLSVEQKQIIRKYLM